MIMLRYIGQTQLRAATLLLAENQATVALIGIESIRFMYIICMKLAPC
jgi:hypothetical protein